MQHRLMILIPAYEDWHSLGLLLDEIDKRLLANGDGVAVLIVDDASTERPPDDLFQERNAISAVKVLRLKVNLGHQRAIAIGLAYIHSNLTCDKIIIMDADGEDRPEDLNTLLRRSAEEGDRYVVFAQRAARSESLLFQGFYAGYRLLFRILTGRSIRFGNFSLVPGSFLGRIVAMQDIWNNYPAALVKARIPFRTVACDRGARLAGKSKMGLVNLILHGLGAISVYNEVFGARSLIASMIVMFAALALGILAVIVRLATNLAIPGWATFAVGLSIVGVLQAVTLSVFFIFLILHSRNTVSFVPGRDYHYFVADIIESSPRHEKP
jgi:glycosyltransferase involved in cell wall biosynthesis